MFEMLKEIKVKILIGYLLLIIVAFFSVSFLFDRFSRLSLPDEVEVEMRNKRSLISETLTLLYESESNLQALSNGHVRNSKYYHRTFDEIYRNLDSLKQLVSDTLQKQRIDSIVVLLAEKESNSLAWLRLLKDADVKNLYEQNIQKEIIRRDSIIRSVQVRKKTVIKQDTLTVQKPRKGFFKRLADAFSTRKEDRNTVYSQSQQLITDTVMLPYNAADTIAGIFSEIQYAVSDQQKKLRDQAAYRNEILRYNNQVLSAKINNLVRELEQEELARSLVRYQNRDTVMRHSVRVVGGIALFSLILIVLFIVFIWKDISRSNRYRRELEESNHRAEDLLKSREQLMLTITHDIKAPLSSIIGYIDLLSVHISEARAKYYVENMKSSSDHLLQLVTDLLDYHRLESDKMEIHNIPFEPYRFFCEIGDSFVPVAGKKNLKLITEIGEGLQGTYSGDPFRIRQIVNNLLSNAIKFTSEGSVSLRVVALGNRLKIQVEDTGIGIAEKDRERIFKEFTRLPGAQGAEGFGLGLSITKKLVQLLGGEILVESISGQGTCFTVMIPFEKTKISIRDKDLEKYMTPDPGRSICCLLVDDDRLQLELTAALMKRYGFTCICCEHPKEVLNLLSKQKFDFVFTDIQMPELSGFDLVRQIRTSTLPDALTIPVIALTARSGMNNDEFISEGFTFRLNKPFTGKELQALILRYYPDCALVSDVKDNSSDPDKELSFSALLSFAGDDKNAAKEILSSFVCETQQNLEKLKTACQCEDVNAISAVAHKLVPLFTLLEHTKCVQVLIELEKIHTVFDSDINRKCGLVEVWLVETISQAKNYISD
ncbi:ATP-binding response regulator [Coprobacter sp.]